jgi:hypothetical protein
MRERSSNRAPDQQQTLVHQQARPHQQQKTQPKIHSRQEPSRQRHKQSGDKQTRSREGREATACKSGGQPQGKKSQHAVPGAPARQQTVSPDKRSMRSSNKSVGSGQAGGEALQLKRKCWTLRQQYSTKVYPPAVFGCGRVMQTWKFSRGQSPCSGKESQGTE